jgi:DNA replication protein DnaC
MAAATESTPAGNCSPITPTSGPEAIGAVIARLGDPRPAHEPTQEDRERAAEQRRALCSARLASLAASLGERHAGCTLKGFEFYGSEQSQAEQKKLRDTLIDRITSGDLVRHTRAGRGILFFGPTGSGKDHLAAALMKVLAGQFAAICKRLSAQNWFRQISEQSATDEQFRSYVAPHVLTISDPVVGNGKLTEAHLRNLFALIDARHDAGRSTWITANVANETKLGELIGSPAKSRLTGGAWIFSTQWPDYRNWSAAK